MKKNKIRACFVSFMLVTVVVFATNKKKKEVPPWMEKIDIGGRSSYLVPKGSKVEKFGAHLVVEGSNEYMGRRFYEIDKYHETIEENQAEFRNQFEEMRKDVEDMKERLEKMEHLVEPLIKEKKE